MIGSSCLSDLRYSSNEWVISFLSASQIKGRLYASQLIIFVEGIIADLIHGCFKKFTGYYEMTLLPGKLPQLRMLENDAAIPAETYDDRKLPEHYSPYCEWRHRSWGVKFEKAEKMIAAIKADKKKLQAAAEGKSYAQNVAALQNMEAAFMVPSRSGGYSGTPPQSPVNVHRPMSPHRSPVNGSPQMSFRPSSPNGQSLSAYHTPPVGRSLKQSPPASTPSVLTINSEENLLLWVKEKLEIAEVIKNDRVEVHNAKISNEILDQYMPKPQRHWREVVMI